jgi:hypothetical protein
LLIAIVAIAIVLNLSSLVEELIIVKESSIQLSVNMLALLGSAAVASTPAMASELQSSQPQNQLQLNKTPSTELPFFARFLESQQPQVAEPKVVLSERRLTEKYPSDHEDGGKQPVFTNKYPSDQEDGGEQPVFTRKYPSDQEDGGGGVVTTQKFPSDQEDGGGGVVTTQKFPSDSDEPSTGGKPPQIRSR